MVADVVDVDVDVAVVDEDCGDDDGVDVSDVADGVDVAHAIVVVGVVVG